MLTMLFKVIFYICCLKVKFHEVKVCNSGHFVENCIFCVATYRETRCPQIWRRSSFQTCVVSPALRPAGRHLQTGWCDQGGGVPCWCGICVVPGTTSLGSWSTRGRALGQEKLLMRRRLKGSEACGTRFGVLL